MLLELISELTFEFSLLIQDSADKSGSCLILTLINNVASGRRVIYVCTEPTFSSKSTYDAANICIINTFDNYDSLPGRLIQAAEQTESIVIFPSISLLLLNYGVSKFSQLLRRLKGCEYINSLIALVHTDVLDTEETLQVVEYMFDAVVNVSQVKEPELISSYYGHAKCTRRKASGKVESSDEYFTLNNTMNVDLVHASSSAVIKALVVDNPAVDITSKLTFNLSLTDKERNAKNNLQLPYLKKESEKQQMLTNTSR